jgi:hypothetical protein
MTTKLKLENVVEPIIEESKKLTYSNGDDLSQQAKPTKFFIKHFLEQDAHGVAWGGSGSYKSAGWFEASHCLCTGRDFMGRKVKQTGIVLYICGEGQGAISRRVRAQIIKNGAFNNNFKILDFPIAIDNPDDMAKLKVIIDELKPVLVIFDTFASLIIETNEIDNGEVGKVLNSVKATCRNGFTSSVIIHHTGKDASKGARGASAFKNNTDFSFEFSRAVGETTTKITCHKMKDGDDFEPFYMKAEVVPLNLFDDDGEESTSIVLVADNNTSHAKKPSLDAKAQKTFDALKEAIERHGVTFDQPDDVIPSWFDKPAKMVSVDSFKDVYNEFTKDMKVGTRSGYLSDGKRSMIAKQFAGENNGFMWIPTDPNLKNKPL